MLEISIEEVAELVENQNIDELKRLVKLGYDIHSDADDVILKSLEYIDIDIIRLLNDNGLDINRFIENHLDELSFKIIDEEPTWLPYAYVLNILLDECGLNPNIAHGALMAYYIRSGMYEVINLVNSGGDPFTIHNGLSLLYIAVTEFPEEERLDQPRYIEFFLKAGCDPNFIPLNQNINIGAHLYIYNIDIENEALSMLFFTIERNVEELRFGTDEVLTKIMILLLDYGADPNWTNINGVSCTEEVIQTYLDHSRDDKAHDLFIEFFKHGGQPSKKQLEEPSIKNLYVKFFSTGEMIKYAGKL